MDDKERDGGALQIELVIEPVPPDTVDNVKAAIEPLVRSSLAAAGQAHLLDSGEIAIDLEQTFPTDAAVTALFYLLGGVALKTFEATLLPEIQRKYRAWVQARTPQPTGQAATQHRTHLHRLLARYFDREELRTLCFNLGIDYDDLEGEGKTNKARELVVYLERHGRLSELVTLGEKLRPHVDWETPNGL